jgi:hypothetical protein
MDDYLGRLAAQDPELARLLAEQDQRLGDPVEQWRTRFPERDQSEEARVRAIVIPLIARAVEMVRDDLRREFRSLVRRARLRRWTRKQMEDFVMSRPRVQLDD